MDEISSWEKKTNFMTDRSNDWRTTTFPFWWLMGLLKNANCIVKYRLIKNAARTFRQEKQVTKEILIASSDDIPWSSAMMYFVKQPQLK